jgi:hypothetical protein
MLCALEWEPATYSRKSVSEIRRSAAPPMAPLGAPSVYLGTATSMHPGPTQV